MSTSAAPGVPAFSTGRQRPQSGPSLAAIAGSVVLHATIVAAALASAQLPSRVKPDNAFKVYRVKMYSPPPQVEGEPADLTPAPTIIKRPIPPKPEPSKADARKPDTKTATTPAKQPAKPAQVTGRNARPGPVGGEGLNVLQDGEDFPDPVYLENIIRQLNRYFRWTGEGGLIAEIGFVINRDGSVTGVRVRRRSGNSQFDLAAVEAIEQAGKRNVFGRLPAVWQPDRLAVAFTFEPAK